MKMSTLCRATIVALQFFLFCEMAVPVAANSSTTTPIHRTDLWTGLSHPKLGGPIKYVPSMHSMMTSESITHFEIWLLDPRYDFADRMAIPILMIDSRNAALVSMRGWVGGGPYTKVSWESGRDVILGIHRSMAALMMASDLQQRFYAFECGGLTQIAHERQLLIYCKIGPRIGAYRIPANDQWKPKDISPVGYSPADQVVLARLKALFDSVDVLFDPSIIEPLLLELPDNNHFEQVTTDTQFMNTLRFEPRQRLVDRPGLDH
jgi:hypothetical protein